MTETPEAANAISSYSGAMLQLRGVDVAIDKVQILRGVGLEVGRGELVALIGRNGAGKTTTLRAIMGLLDGAAGKICLDGELLSAMPSYKRAKLGVGYMPEDRRLIPHFTVGENILMPTWLLRVDNVKHRLDEVYSLMPEVAGFAKRQALSLSGGQQKLVALGRALLVGQTMLLLDEPFEGVAPALVQRLNEIMSVLSSSNERTVLVCDSSLDESNDVYDRHIYIERGQVSTTRIV